MQRLIADTPKPELELEPKLNLSLIVLGQMILLLFHNQMDFTLEQIKTCIVSRLLIIVY
jgi:hypothetical protein